MAAAFGVAAAMGLYIVSLAAGGMALVVMLAFGSLKPYVLSPRSRRRLDITHIPGRDTLDALITAIGEVGGRLSVVETVYEEDLRHTSITVWGVATPELNRLLRRLAERDDVVDISPPPPPA